MVINLEFRKQTKPKLILIEKACHLSCLQFGFILILNYLDTEAALTLKLFSGYEKELYDGRKDTSQKI